MVWWLAWIKILQRVQHYLFCEGSQIKRKMSNQLPLLLQISISNFLNRKTTMLIDYFSRYLKITQFSNINTASVFGTLKKNSCYIQLENSWQFTSIKNLLIPCLFLMLLAAYTFHKQMKLREWTTKHILQQIDQLSDSNTSRSKSRQTCFCTQTMNDTINIVIQT